MEILWNVPALDVDAGVSIRPEGRLERRIVWNLLAALESAGFLPVAVFDGDETEPAETARAAMEHVFAVDDSRVYFRHKNGGRREWVLLILGNGIDVVSDYTAGDAVFTALLDGFLSRIETLA